jgi:hypothetical protein
VSISSSSAIVKAVAEGTIAWERDPDFGYEVARSLPGVDDTEILQPRRLYERTGRVEEYRTIVERLSAERRAFLATIRRPISRSVSAHRTCGVWPRETASMAMALWSGSAGSAEPRAARPRSEGTEADTPRRRRIGRSH